MRAIPCTGIVQFLPELNPVLSFGKRSETFLESCPKEVSTERVF
jgi:hypothetical protein